ncbi:hypothetical protein MTYP_00650 [Methylophilaceae bacterium]|nr:hypothetical protein MTYP_00650 [Methylophilaceae bacterium]
MTINGKTLGWAGMLGMVMGCGSHALAESPAAIALTDAEQAAVFKAAGFTLKGKEWRACDTGDSGAPYEPGTIQEVRDLNGDGRPEAVVTEGGTYCYGFAGMGFTLLSKQANGSWRVMTSNTGIAEFLKTHGVGGWPDISVGGPGFCFPVERWNGKEYKLHRFEYEGKRCKPAR